MVLSQVDLRIGGKGFIFISFKSVASMHFSPLPSFRWTNDGLLIDACGHIESTISRWTRIVIKSSHSHLAWFKRQLFTNSNPATSYTKASP